MPPQFSWILLSVWSRRLQTLSETITKEGRKSQQPSKLAASKRGLKNAQTQLDDSTCVGNQWLFSKPGTHNIYKGFAIPEGVKTRSAHRVGQKGGATAKISRERSPNPTQAWPDKIVRS